MGIAEEAVEEFVELRDRVHADIHHRVGLTPVHQDAELLVYEAAVFGTTRRYEIAVPQDNTPWD